jgi:hypothetical protein
VLLLPPDAVHVTVANGRVAYKSGTNIFVTVPGHPTKAVPIPSGMGTYRMSLSPDGRMLYICGNLRHGPSAPFEGRAAFLTIGDDGSVTQPVHWVDLPALFPTFQWTPDGTAVIAKAFWGNEVWRIPARAGAAQMIRHRETGAFGPFVLSPDGKEMAIGASQEEGSTFWRIDLKQAARGVKKQ